MNLSRAIGIDLGTTNSAVAMLSADGQEISLLEDRFKRKTFPSMVGWDPETNTILTAWEAWNRRTLTPTPVASIKRRMGTSRTSTIGPHELTPEIVSAEILKRLISEMQAHLKRDEDTGKRPHHYKVNRAVVTIPAYFDAQQIEATRQAGEQANIEVLGLLQEPTAAAMYYAWKHTIGDGNFLVYDLGGGTFDVSIIRCIMGEYQVLGIDGDNFLGGDDIDKRLAEHFRKHLIEQGYKLDLDIQNNDDDRTRFTLLQRLAQEVKEALSHNDIQYVARRDIFTDQEGQKVSIEMEFSRTQFENLIQDFVQETLYCCERALLKSAETADVTLRDIDYVLLVGGSTRIPLVQQEVAKRFCGRERSNAEKPLINEPDTCVALGAAIHAANLGGLEVYNEQGEEHITLLTALSSDSGALRLAAKFSPTHADEAILDEIESAVLINAQGDVEAITRPEISGDAPEIYFAIESISLPDPGEYLFSLELCDEEGDPIYAFELGLSRLGYGEQLRATGSALSNPSVLAKDIYLEVVRDGRPARQILLPTGTSLPADGKFRFYTADQSGAVILRLFQNRLPIRTIHLSIPKDTESGTPVDLNLEIDDTMNMTASGEVLGQSFWAQIEPPPERELREWSDIEALLERVDQVERELWGYEERSFRERTDLIVAGIHETARTDPDKLQVLVSRLEDVLEDYHSSAQDLTPGWGRFTGLLNAIKRVVWRGDDQLKLGQTSEQWRERLGDLERRGDEAFQDHNQAEWSKIFNQTQAIWESLAQDEYRFTRGDPMAYVAKLQIGVQESYQQLVERIEEFNFSSNPETAQLQKARLYELKQDMKSRVEAPLRQLDIQNLPPAQSRQQLDKIAEYVQYLERQLEKIPAIGLVRK